MKLIRQKHARGCCLATLAMLLDGTYEEMATAFSRSPWENRPPRDFEKEGVYQQEAEVFLHTRGYAILVKYTVDRLKQEETRPWPPEPFADKHLCVVEVYDKAPCNHIVAMERDGTVLDPMQDEPKRLTDYFRVLNVVGLFKVMHVQIKIGEKSDPTPLFPQSHGTKVVEGELTRVGILEGGMASGKPSISMMIDMPDGSVVFVQTSAAIFDSIGGALRGACQRWGVEL